MLYKFALIVCRVESRQQSGVLVITVASQQAGSRFLEFVHSLHALPIGVNVSVSGCLAHWIDWQPVHGIPCLAQPVHINPT